MLKISVILLVYNKISLLRKSLLSLNYQSYLPDEVIITDDGSEEDIVSSLKKIKPMLKYPLKYIRQENIGFRAAKARNNGVRFSTNDYLIFIDQDIISTRDYLKTFVQNADPQKFIVSYPIRLTKEQSKIVDEKVIELFKYNFIIRNKQKYSIKKQYLKDYFSYIQKKIKVRKKGVKLRSGVFAIHRKNYEMVNGFDEMYMGWGNEDDDLGNRLEAANIIGFNPFWHEFPLHLFHPPHHINGGRVNKTYYEKQMELISPNNFYCKFGLNNTISDENLIVMDIE